MNNYNEPVELANTSFTYQPYRGNSSFAYQPYRNNSSFVYQPYRTGLQYTSEGYRYELSSSPISKLPNSVRCNAIENPSHYPNPYIVQDNNMNDLRNEYNIEPIDSEYYRNGYMDNMLNNNNNNNNNNNTNNTFSNHDASFISKVRFNIKKGVDFVKKDVKKERSMVQRDIERKKVVTEKYAQAREEYKRSMAKRRSNSLDYYKNNRRHK
ncbi:MAG: hypothetical protein JO112_23030 [Planctomycetes bacterium]|nr:hypothetical protein [Planctomycetota bacterium]